MLKTLLSKENLSFDEDELVKKLNNCGETHTEVHFDKGYESNSASATDIYVVNIKQMQNYLGSNNTFIMKIFDVDQDTRSGGLLQYENSIYNLTNTFLDKHYTRNIVSKIAYSKNCTFNDICMVLSNKNGCDTEIQKQLLENLSIMYCSPYKYQIISDHNQSGSSKPISKTRPAIKKSARPSNPALNTFVEQCAKTLNTSQNDLNQKLFHSNYGFIMTKAVDGGSFHEFMFDILKSDFSDDDIYYLSEVIYQIFFTLHVFASRGMNHNDIHLGNALIDKKKLPYETEFSLYVTPDKQVRCISSKFIPRIFDFDRATTSQKPNKMEQNLENSGQSNRFNSRRDFIKFSCYLLRNIGGSIDTFQKNNKKNQIKLKNMYNWIINSITVKNKNYSLGKVVHDPNNQFCFFQRKGGMVSYLSDDKWLREHIKPHDEIINSLTTDPFFIYKYTDADFYQQKISKTRALDNIFTLEESTRQELYKVLLERILVPPPAAKIPMPSMDLIAPPVQEKIVVKDSEKVREKEKLKKEKCKEKCKVPHTPPKTHPSDKMSIYKSENVMSWQAV